MTCIICHAVGASIITDVLQEALHREQMLENKLATLQRLVENTQSATEAGWQVNICPYTC